MNHRWACPLGLLILASLLLGTVAQAQHRTGPPTQRSVLVDVVDDDQWLPDDDGDRQRQMLNQVRGLDRRLLLDAQGIDQQVFGGSRHAGLRNLDTLLKIERERLAAICQLTAEQQTKLELAGSIETRRLLERLEYLQDQYADQQFDEQQFAVVRLKLSQLSEQFRRKPFDADAYVLKVFHSLLDEHQQERWQRWNAQRHAARLAGWIDMVIADIDMRIPLLASQREQLRRLLQEQVRPTQALENQLPAAADGLAARAAKPAADGAQPVSLKDVVLAQMNQIAPETYRQFLRDEQWEELKQIIRPHQAQLHRWQADGLLPQPSDDDDQAEEPSG